MKLTARTAGGPYVDLDVRQEFTEMTQTAQPPKPAKITSDWTRPVQPGQVEALRAALFGPAARKVRGQ